MDWIFHKYFLLKRKFKTILSKKEIIEGEKEIYFKGILSNKNQTSKPVYGNAVLWVGIGLLSLNSFCGLFAIHSYPFSAYPSYSDLVPNEIEILHFEGYDSQGTEIDVLEEAEMISFRRENFTIFENNIIADVKKEISVEDQILKYWKIWYLNVPALQEITHLKVYYHKTPVLPDKRKELIINELIFDGPAKQE